MKKIIISGTVCLMTFLVIFLIVNGKENKDEKTENKNISIILETEEGNLEKIKI